MDRPANPALDWLIDLADRMTEAQRATLLLVLQDAVIGAGESTCTADLRRIYAYERAIAHIAGA